MTCSDIQLDGDDLAMIIAVSRLGVAHAEQLAFATGDFSGRVNGRIERLVARKAISLFLVDAETGRRTYCATAEGLISAYLHDAYVRSNRAIRKSGRVKTRGLGIFQRHVVRLPVRGGGSRDGTPLVKHEA